MHIRKGLLLIVLALLATPVPHLLREQTLAQEKASASENIVLPQLHPIRLKVSPRGIKPAPRTRVIAMAKPQTLLPVVDQADIEPRHRQIAHDVLMALPAQCRSALKKFYVRYDKPSQRGLAGKNTLILSGNVSDSEFRALLVHELGHVFDLNPDRGCLGGTPLAGGSEFKDGADPVYNDDPSLDFYRITWTGPKAQRAGVKPEDFVSGYAAHDAFEDFAESHAYFVLHNDLFKQRAAENAALAAKYEWFQTNLYPNGVALAQTKDTWNGSVPWDITKMAYVWTAVASR